MKTIRFLGVAGLLGFLSFGPPIGAAAQDLRPPEVRAAAVLEETWRSSGVPGVSVVLAREGRLLFSHSLGYADLEHLVPTTGSTVYNIGSVSKVIAAVAVMQLVERGEIGLDDPVRKYIPEFGAQSSPVTIRQIMTHTSGIRHYRTGERLTPFGPYETFEAAIEIFKDDPLHFEPGGFYLYSSFAVNLLQGVVERTSGLSFEEYLSRNVWGPAGMMTTGFDIPSRIVPGRARGYDPVDGGFVNHPYEDATYKFAGGGMIGSVEDLVRFGVALNHDRLLERGTRQLMFEPQFDELYRFRENGPPEPIVRWQQALMWRVRKDDGGRSFVYHCGTVKGFNACLVLYVEEDLVLAIANNSEAIGFRPLLEIADVFRQAASAPDSEIQ